VDLACRRDSFDLPEHITYLNCAYMGPLSKPVVAAGREGIDRKVHPWTITSRDFFDPVGEARELFAQVIDADAAGVALIPSVSYGVAVAAQNLPLHAGERVIVLAEEFPSNFYAWREVAGRVGAEVVTVPRPGDLDWTRSLLEVIDERAAIVAIVHCHWTDGGMVDLVRVSERVRDAGAALVIDGTQSIGALPLDVDAIKPDFVVTANYKWLLGPYSSGFMWVAPQHREGRPIEFSWMTREGSNDFAHLVNYVERYRPGARRYDVGETSNFVLLPMISAALSQILGWGVGDISAYIGALTDRLATGVQDIGLSVAPKQLRSPHLVGVHLKGMDAEALAEAMAAAEVFVSVRGDAMRVSPHVYNDADDIDRLIEVLRTSL
jgi:selenocysteine lyase/cysteine desulfurase